MPIFRPGLGDDPERVINHEHGYIEYRHAPGQTCEMVNLEVNSDHRRKGVGRALVKALIETLHHDGSGCRLVYAITRTNNPIAQHFYETLGFRVVGVLRDFYDAETGGVDAIVYGRSPKGPI